MNKEIQELLPEEDQSVLSEHFNPHQEELRESAQVDFLALPLDMPDSAKEIIRQERRKRGWDNAANIAVIKELKKSDEKSKIDKLTGLRSKLAFDGEAQSIFDRVGPGEATFLFIDVNGLKRANDHDHNVGNSYLASVADSLLARLRPTDLLYRIGGDEIVAVLGGEIEEDIIDELSERIETSVATDLEEANLPPDLYPGISVGGAVKHEGETLEQCIKRADQASIASKDKFYQNILDSTGKDLRR